MPSRVGLLQQSTVPASSPQNVSQASCSTSTASSYHVHVLILVEPFARHSSIKSQEWEGTEYVFIQLQIIAMNVMRHLQKP